MRDALEMLLLDVHLGTTEGLADDQINHPNLFSVFLPFPVRFLTLRGLSFVTLRHLGRVYLHFYGSQGDEKTVNRRVSLCCTHSESLGQKWKFTLGLIHSHPDPFGAQVEWRLTSVFSASWDNFLVWSLIFALLAWCKTDNRLITIIQLFGFFHECQVKFARIFECCNRFDDCFLEVMFARKAVSARYIRGADFVHIIECCVYHRGRPIKTDK